MLLVLRGLAESLKKKDYLTVPKFPGSPALFLFLSIFGQTAVQELFFFPHVSR